MVTSVPRVTTLVLNCRRGRVCRRGSGGRRDLDGVRAAEVEVVGDQGLEEAAGIAGLGEHQRAGDLDLGHRQLPPVAGVGVGGVSGSGSRASQRWKNTLIVPGPSRSQIACNAAGSSVAANPLDSSVNPIPAWVAWRLAHSCPLTQTLIGHGQ